MSLRVEIKPELLHWAIERSGVDRLALQKRFGKLDQWLAQTVKPTLKQVEAFAKATYTPIGFLFLPEPPDARLPTQDFRTLANAKITRPGANLLATIYSCQQRQYWYREYLLNHGEPERAFVGSTFTRHAIEDCARAISRTIGFDVRQRASLSTWEEALIEFIDAVEGVGVLVMRSGIVDNNTRRKLSVAEFRGFALADSIAPLIFINGADTRSAQMFTLAHELAHIWLGQSALSDADMSRIETHRIERWCNQVAAELLVPMQQLREQLPVAEPVANALARLAKVYKVSTLVVLRRLFDAGQFSKTDFFSLYQKELDRLVEISQGRASGGDFYRNQPRKLSPTFARALIGSTLEGQTLYRDAMRMLGIKKVKTLNGLGRKLGVLM